MLDVQSLVGASERLNYHHCILFLFCTLKCIQYYLHNLVRQHIFTISNMFFSLCNPGYDVTRWKDVLLKLNQTKVYFTTNAAAPFCSE